MNYQVEVPPEVRKEIKALPGHVRAKELRDKPNIIGYQFPTRRLH